MFAVLYSISHFRGDDNDAAIAYTVQAIAMAGLTTALLIEAGAVFLGMGPVGWAFLIIGIIAGIIAYMLTDTDLEKWAKHGPFGNGNNGIPKDLYKDADEKKIYESFMTLLMSPGIQIETDRTTSPTMIMVTAIAPGFQQGKGAITLDTTYQSSYKMSSREQAYAITRMQLGPSGTSKVQSFQTESRQHRLKCLKWEPVYDDKTPQQIGVKYYYQLPIDRRDGEVKYHIRARVKHITEEGYIIPTHPDKKVLSSYTDQIDKEQNGWAYKELTVYR